MPGPLLPGVEAANKVQARATNGRFTRMRWATLWATQLFFFGIPWLQWHGRQLARFDLEAKRFYLGNLILLPQDLIFLTGLLVFCAMLLFVVTTLAGRVWCGFSCPQTVYTELFMWVERRFEGDRHLRLKLDRSPWTAQKLLRRGGKQATWVAISLWTGFTFVGWFSPIREMAQQALHLDMGFWDTFWAGFYGLLCYTNAGFLREKVCLHMCPYGRFQGALMDADTLIVAYDAQRGEPRGTQREARNKASAQQAGACVDCTVCVQVCPTGIDIRQGAQAACISCALCIDACDHIMDRIGQPRGLIRFATPRELDAQQGAGANTATPVFARHRVRIYAGLMALAVAALVWSVMQRPDVRVDVIRDRGVMARMVDDGVIENVYRLQLMNQTEVLQRIDLGVDELPGAQVVVREPMLLGPIEDRQVMVAVRLPAAEAARLRGKILGLHFRIASRSDNQTSLIREPSTFIVPR
ncbi:cytochrome c oxidase accessory protein CcoG [Aquabacterium sp.]|uniref:cytochrome c oxidase accessory protein CcoG n=1 Tax=Aquabacterium sp. TaxID=1872578 RepID=UPI0027B9015C|nr:cytochrome c oxidase accessory protein CcoG [Aquabacterium sp.]